MWSLQEAETDLVVDESPIGRILGAQRGKPSLGIESLAPLSIDAGLFGYAGRARLVEQRIKGDGLTCLRIDMLAVAGRGGTRG